MFRLNQVSWFKMDTTTNYSFAAVWGKCSFYKYELGVIKRIPSNAYYVNYMIVLACNIFLAVSTVFLNSVTILACMRSALLNSKKSYFLIMLLSVNDLLVGLFGNGSFVLVYVAIILEYRKCEVYILITLTYFFTGMSIMTLFGLNIERYLSILHPFYHRTKVTKSKLLKMIAGFWLLVIALGLSRFVFAKIMNKMTSTLLVFVAFLTLYIYVAIYITVRRQPQVMIARRTNEQATEAREQEQRRNLTKWMQNIKMAKSCAIVVCLTFICNLPYAVVVSFPKANFNSLLGLWCFITILSVSSLNSLVLFWNNPVLRQEAKKLFKNLNQ